MGKVRIVVIGGGIAGVSAAYHLSRHVVAPEVVLVEAEGELAAHSTGRSAAQYIRNYGAAPVRSLTVASHHFFTDPPDDFCRNDLLSPRAMVTVADSEHADDLRAAVEQSAVFGAVTEISPAEAAERFPPLRADRFVTATVEEDSADIDVAELHQTFLRGFRAAGGLVRTSFRVDSALRSPNGSTRSWSVESTDGVLDADLLVNAAGAWGDVVAQRAGVEPVGLQPMRRTAFMVGCDHPGSERWPLISPVEHSWYVKPDGAQLLCSPANEDPMEPCDVKPEELDIALAIERINEATTLGIVSVRSSWAGLRSFVADRSMVIGPDPQHGDFIWCVGQGGTGIQTAPAAGRFLADLVLDGGPGDWIGDCGLDPTTLTPERLRSSVS